MRRFARLIFQLGLLGSFGSFPFLIFGGLPFTDALGVAGLAGMVGGFSGTVTVMIYARVKGRPSASYDIDEEFDRVFDACLNAIAVLPVKADVVEEDRERGIVDARVGIDSNTKELRIVIDFTRDGTRCTRVAVRCHIDATARLGNIKTCREIMETVGVAATLKAGAG